MKDGINIIKVMRGRRRMNIDNDSEILDLFKNGWQINEIKIVKKITQKKYGTLIKAGE